jgi:parallel beta-helix repeat protein
MIIKNLIYCALITLIAFSTPALADHNIVGDVNNDGMITAADSLLALQMSAGSIAPDLEIADVNADGKVNSPDALMILMMAQKAQVCVDAPEVVSGTFNARINMYNVADLDSGQFDLSFDASVVNVISVDSGSIDGTEVPVDMWELIDSDTIRVVFNLPDTDGVSGSGTLATISFEVLGVVDDTSVLAISDGLLVNIESNEISSLWFDDGITVGIPADVIVKVPVTVNAPPVVTGTFEVTIDVENVTDLDCGQFDLSFDPNVVTVEGVEAGSIGNISGTAVPIHIWAFMNVDTIRVLFNIPGFKGASGSGCVAKITFELTGIQGDSCVLDVFRGSLGNNNAEVMPSIWNDCEVTIGEYTPVNRVRNINTGEDFPFIRTAIDDPDTLDGHVIEVEDGVYHEYVKVNKSLTIRSLNGSANCVIQDVGYDHVVEITADHVNISGFTVTRRAGRSASDSAGIYLNASHCNVSGNTCSNKGVGIHLDGSGNNSISSNDCSHNWDGIYLDGSCDNSISSNNFSNNCNGIHLNSSGKNRLTGNIMFLGGIFIQGDSLNDYIHEIDESNIVNGKPIYYLKDIESVRIPDRAGQVILVNCTDILVEDQELNDASVGINVAFSSNITIRNNTCSNNNYAGIFLDGSSNSSILHNNCSNNRAGWGFFDNYGICLDGSDNNIISNNTCLNNWDGICIERSCSNVIYLNNFINSNYNCDPSSSTNIYNSTSKINYTYREKTFANYLGNYWDDYTVSDSDKDGIGDYPYRINSDNDNYPLMMPFENYFAPEATMTRVCVNAPEVVSATFDVAIDIHNVVDLDRAQFDLTFDPGVVNVTEVKYGHISGERVPIDSWEFIGADTITVVLNPRGAT